VIKQAAGIMLTEVASNFLQERPSLVKSVPGVPRRGWENFPAKTDAFCLFDLDFLYPYTPMVGTKITPHCAWRLGADSFLKSPGFARFDGEPRLNKSLTRRM
jgi:hypothetical protein